MSNVHRTIIVPAGMVNAARQLGKEIAPGGHGMYTTGLSPTGNEPSTHYISAGLIEDGFAYIMSSAAVMAEATGLPVEQAEAILSVCVVSEDSAFVVMARLGLVMVEES